MLTNLFLGQTAEEKNFIEDLFSCYLYTGNGSTQTITNGIDLAGKGGMVWLKARSFSHSNALYDTNRGSRQALSTNLTAAQYTAGAGQELYTFGSSGFTLGSDANFSVNTSGVTFSSWTFRKAPKFFDVVTYTGNGTAGRTISHSLGVAPGMIIVKRTDAAVAWQVYHRSLPAGTYGTYNLVLSDTAAQVDNGQFAGTATSTSFSVQEYGGTNASGGSYVAYLFAHDTTADGVIQCGSYTTDGSGNATVNLGWEPQYILVKSTTTGQWWIVDNMRGLTSGGGVKLLAAQSSGAEQSYTQSYFEPNSTGFKDNGTYGAVSTTVIYLAIRRGPMRVPTDATKVFSPVARTGTGTTATITTSFVTDLAVGTKRATSGGNFPTFIDRLRGNNVFMFSSSTTNENTDSSLISSLADNTGYVVGADSTGYGYFNESGVSLVSWNFARAPGFFDVVCYTTTNSTNQRITHNLGVAPEMIITKKRGSAGSWFTYVAALGRSKYLSLNGTAASNGFGNDWGTSDPTSTDFGYNTQIFQSSPYSGNTVVAYLFATCPGVSKVGSYTGTGTTQQINCGFTNGARFVLIKRTDSTGDWTVWDTARGIVSGNDPYLLLNSTAAEVTNTDYIDPLSTGFEISSTAPAAINANGGTFVFLAIA